MNSAITKYLYDGEDILYELDGSNQIISRFTHGPGIDEPIILERDTDVYYYHTDGLGSITKLTNASGTVVRSYLYDSFGTIVDQSGTVTQPYTYTGREYDEESELYYYRARYYDAKIGRFLSEDPSHRLQPQRSNIPYILTFTLGVPQELNKYPYVINNPINLIDPKGLLPRDWAEQFVNSTEGKCLKCNWEKIAECVNKERTTLYDCLKALATLGWDQQAFINCTLGAFPIGNCYYKYCRMVPCCE